MTPSEFEDIMNTQVGGTPIPEMQQAPKNIKPVQQPVAPSVEVNKTVNIEQPIVAPTPSPQPVPEPQKPQYNEEFVKQMYDYANKYSLMTAGREANYDNFLAKYASSPEGVSAFYDNIIPMSRILPAPTTLAGKKDEFISKAFTQPKQTPATQKTADISSFIRSPFQTDTEGYNENITKGIQEDISGNAVSIANKQENISDNITEAATIKIDDVKKKYGLMQEGKKAVVEGMVGTAEEMIPKEKSIFEKMEEAKGADPSAEKIKKIEDDITLKNWDPAYSDLSLNGIPEMDLKSAGLGEAPKFTFNTDKLNADKSKYESRKSFLTQYTDRDRELYGDNPFVRLVAPKDQVQFHWDKDVIKNGSSIDYWSTIPLEARTRTHKGALLPGEKEVSFDEYVYKDKSTVPMMDVDGIQDFEIIKKLPAPAAKIFDDYMKYLSNTDKQMAINAKAMRQMKEGSFDAPGTVEKVTGYWKDIIGKAQGKENIRVSDDLIKYYSASNGKMMSDVDELNLLNSAFDNQRRIIVGEYQSKSNPTDEDYKKAETALKKIDLIWDLTINDPANSINITKVLSKQDHAYLDELNNIEREKKEKITEEKFREKYPTLGFLKYNVFKPVIYGAEAGAVSIMSDIIDLPRKVTGYELVSKEDISTGLKEYEESVPTQLRGSIINKDGGIEFDNLLYQGAKVTTEMVGTMGFAKGFSVVLGPALNATSLPVKIKEGASVAAGAFTQYRNDAEMSCYNAMIDAGYSKEYSEAVSYDYGINTAVGWALVEPIAAFPLQKSFTNNVLKDFSALLGKGYTPWKAMYKSTISNTGRIAKELTTQTAEEVSGDAWETMQNISVNRRLKTNVLDAEMTLKDIAETGLVTTAVTLFGMGKRGDLYKSSVSQKAAVWGAVNNSGVFQEQLDKWVKEGKLDKQQASFMKQGVDEVKNVITGLPSAKPLTESQKIDLGLLIYEKKKLDEEVKSGYVDELFRQQKMTEIEEKKKKLDSEILKVYNQNNDRNAVLKEMDRILKEKRDAEIEAEKMVVKTRIEGLKETQKRVQSNVEELEEEEKLAEDLITAQRTREQEPAKKKARGGQAAKVAPEQRFDIKDGHHRTMARTELGETEIEAVDQDGNKITVPIEQLQPTEDLATKDREVIDGLKESITKGEPVEPIKVEAVTPTQEAEALSDLTLYHGGHKNIEEEGFNDSKFGTGYGNMMSGAGHYLTDSKDEAKGHMSQAASKQENINDLIEKQLNNNEDRVKYKKYKIAYEKYNKIKQALEAGKNIDVNKSKGIVDRLLKILTDIKNYYYNKKSHTLFSSLLDMELQVLSTKESIAEKIRGTKEVALNIEPYSVKIKNGDLLDLLKPVTEKLKNEIKKDYPDLPDDIFKNGHMLYEWLSRKYNSDIKASKYLSSKGIIGNKFRSAGSNHYIIYSGSNISVLNKPYTGIKQAKTETGKETDVLTEPKVEQIKTEQDAKEVRSAQKRPNEQGQVGKASAKKTKASRNVQTPKESPKVEVPKVEPVVTEAEKEPEIIRTAREEERKVVDEIEPKQTALRSEVKNSSNETVKKGLSAIDKGLDQANDLTEVKVDGKGFREWVRNAKDSGRITQEEFDNLNKKFDQHKKDFGKKKTAYERVRKAVERAAGIKFIGTDRAGMNIFTIPLNMPIAIIKGTAMVMLKAMDAAATMDYKIVGKATVDHMRKSKWFQNLSPKEKSAINKFIKENGEFEAMTMIIDEGARDYDSSGENIAKEIVKEKKAAEKTKAKVKEGKKQVREKAKAKAKAKKDINTLKEKANSLRSRLGKRMKGEIGVNDKKMIGLLRTLDPNALFRAGKENLLETYIGLAERLLHDTGKIRSEKGMNKIKAPERAISQTSVNEFMKEAEKALDDYAFEQFKKKNEFRIKAFQVYGFLSENPSRQEIESVFEKYNIETRKMDEEIDEQTGANKLVEIQEAVKEDIDRLKKEKFEGMDAADKKVVDNISSLEVDKLTPSQLVKAHYTINNIIANGVEGLAGAGQVEAIAISQQTERMIDDILKKHGLKNFRDISKNLNNTYFKNTPAVIKTIGIIDKAAAEITQAMKRQDLISGYGSVIRDISKNYDKEISKLKKKYGRKITNNHENQIRQGMYAIALQWQGDTDSSIDKEAWFEENKKLLLEDIARKEKSGNFEVEVELEKKIYDKVFQNAGSMDQLSGIMARQYPGDKAMVDLTQKMYEKNKKDLQRASYIYANEDLDLWNNYTHRRWKSTKADAPEFDPLNPDDSVVKTLVDKYVNRKAAQSTFKRTKQLPSDDKVLNLNFYNVQRRVMHESYYMAKTLGTRFAIKEIIANPNIRTKLGTNTHDILSQGLINAVNYQMGLTSKDYGTYKAINKVANYIIRWQTSKALAGLYQYPVQLASAIFNAVARNPEYAIKTFRNVGRRVENTNLFEHSSMKLRKDAVKEQALDNLKEFSQSQFYGKANWMKPVVDFGRKTFKGIDGLSARGADLVLKPLQWGDYTAAKAAWMSYYERQWVKDHPDEKFIWEEHYKTPDKDASAYADQMIETSMNVNDGSNASNFQRDQNPAVKAVRTIFTPFSAFAISQDFRLINAIRNLGSMNQFTKKESKKDAFFGATGDIMSVITEQIVFQYAKAASISAMALGAGYMAGLFGGGDDEEEEALKKGKFKNIFTKEFFNKALMNAGMDFIPTSAFLSPFGMNAAETQGKKVLNKLFGEWFGEDYKNTFPLKRGLTDNGMIMPTDPNFEVGADTAIILDFLGMFGSAADDLYSTWAIGDVLITGYDKKNGDIQKLTPYQRNVLFWRLLTNVAGAGAGINVKEWDNMLRFNEYVVKDQLKKGKGGGSSGGGGIRQGRVRSGRVRSGRVR